jgi:hypothetical protein
LENTTQSERSQTQKATCCVIRSDEPPRTGKNPQRQKVPSWLLGYREEELQVNANRFGDRYGMLEIKTVVMVV